MKELKNKKDFLSHAIEIANSVLPRCQTSCRLKKLTLRHGGNSGITLFRSIY